MRKLLYTPAVVALSAALGGFAAVHAALPSAAMAQDSSAAPASPSPASLPSASPLDTGGTRLIIDRMEQRLAANVNGTSDRQYVATMAALSPAIVAVCKQEMHAGSDANLRATAQKILTVEQENRAYLQRYATTFHINQSAL